MNHVRRIFAATLLLTGAACSDTGGPIADTTVQGDLVASAPSSSSSMHDIQQSRSAPSLVTYRVSFWAVKGQDRAVQVSYSDGQQFLQFAVPAQGLSRAPDGSRYRNGDSVLISLAIDPVKFRVKFDPSGLQFSNTYPASLSVWYGYADADLNGDGVVNSTDLALRGQLSLWSQQVDTDPWQPAVSSNDALQSWVVGAVPHFSGYAVSW